MKKTAHATMVDSTPTSTVGTPPRGVDLPTGPPNLREERQDSHGIVVVLLRESGSRSILEFHFSCM
jgi:hypothetical protein